ncbi:MULTISPECIES: hypothetical protein [unclassified Bosea (in: a-proteobacteria)]|uniref:hypothetical protein n=1 Tax=unclassified Bosea (in: a-proteobacteria) TaxID=2653178 RepID=UPI000F761654|nr:MULTISPECIES: hypothetical protein [unclassified Bosea (in: a-proteobacteria)]AZO77776.1 hypothetical protein BLM15_09215 [Bosea sp. Tri-49]RXT18392.1 hypothetical protein B5U98_24370 [Bosea sp. Tri-39]RXT32989.1 hypothetical protein B5U99_30715 [Bosea sp. Tri-54]
MKKTLIAAALTLAGSLGSLALQSPASAASGGSGSHGLITTVANRTTPSQQMVQPRPETQPLTQTYPAYHDSPTASWFSQPVNRMPCHFTQAVVEGRMRQVEICD